VTSRYGSPDYWQQHQAAVSREWWKKWLPSLKSDLTFEDALASGESFVLMLRDIGLGFRTKLAAEVANPFVLAPPAMLPVWFDAFERLHRPPPMLLSIHSLHQLGEGDLQLLNDKTLIVEAPVGDKTKAKERLASVCYGRRAIVYTHFGLTDGKPPPDASTALKIVNRGRAPVPVVWEPPILPPDLTNALGTVGIE
jgi:hypothetical protein